MDNVLAKDYKEIHGLAIQAYMQVWRDNHLGFCPPPTQIRDKKWSEILRSLWPDFTTVDISTRGDKIPRPGEIRKWCEGKGSNFWVNGTGNRWYFERRDIAALFKLTFGGAYHD